MQYDNEIWKNIKEYPEYEISSHGRIKNKKSNKIFDIKYTANGYLCSRIYQKKKTICVRPHILVAKNFLEIPDGKILIKHKDGNKLNNFYENLEICQINTIIIKNIKTDNKINIKKKLSTLLIKFDKDEQFKLINNFPKYVVSNFGRVINIFNGHILKSKCNKNGFPRLTLIQNQQQKHFFVHKLVMNYFNSNNEKGVWHVKHIDKDKSNNHINNLKWVKFSKDISKLTMFDILEKGEEWRNIENYPWYLISSRGRILDIKFMKIKIIQTHKSGYMRACISNENGKKQFRIHRLVAKAFIPPINGKNFVNHINGIKNDNRVDNLEWVTAAENIKKAYETGLLKLNFKNRFGTEIEQYDLEGNLIKNWNSISEAARKLNIKQSKIRSSIISKNDCNGFKWKVKKEIKISNEIWKNINKYPNYYISNFGRIKNKKNILRPSITNGYYGINLFNKEKKIRMQIHILVAKQFINNPKDLPFVNHINGNRLDNRIENLEWIDNSGNMIHAFRIGLFKPKVCKVNQLSLDGTLIKEWKSISEASKTLKILDSGICEVCKGKNKTYKGFKWEYRN